MSHEIGVGESPNANNSLASLFGASSPNAYTLMARAGNNLGNPTLVFSVPMADFYRLSIIANDPVRHGPAAQRKLDTAHAAKLARYVLKGLISTARSVATTEGRADLETCDSLLSRLDPQPYVALQPLVVNVRTAGLNGANLRGKRFPASGPIIGFEVELGQRDLFWVVDGQHRRMGIEMALDFLEEVRRTRAYPKKGSLLPSDESAASPLELQVLELAYECARSLCTVAVEAHLGLGIEQERQLFHDLNNLTKKVEKSLALQFDSSNPVNQYIKERLVESGKIKLAEGDKVDWNDHDTGAFTRKDLVAINAHLLLNKSNINGATRAAVEGKLELADRFWDAIAQCDGFGEANARSQTVLAQPVVLKALAKLTYDFSFGRAKQRSESNLKILLDGVTDLDFTHSNPMWRYYEMSEGERAAAGLEGLATYLPPESTGNRDLGSVDGNGCMRFGAKHNDIFPIIGDMIRWRLGLPSRHSDDS